MATIQQHIALSDGVSPVFNRIATAAEQTTGRLEKAAEAANRVDNAVSVSARNATTNITNASINVMPSLDAISIKTDEINNKMKNAGAGAFGKVKNALSSAIGQFAMGNLIASGIEKVANSISNAIHKLTDSSDAYSGVIARLNLITGSQEKTIALNDQIYYSALRARGSYASMADAVSKIAMTAKEAFPDAKEVVPFMEGIQKLFTIGGTGVVQQKDALLQLTQALGSGKLQGDEFRSIAEAAPLIEQMVAKYMGVTQGELKQLSSDGKITADIIKNAVLGNMDEINTKFKSMPITWEQVWGNMETVAFRAFIPVFQQISAIANSDGMKSFGEKTGSAFIFAGQSVAGFINNVRWFGGEISSFYSTHQTIFEGIGSILLFTALAWGVYKTAVVGATLATMAWGAVTTGAQSVGILIMMVTDLTRLFYTMGVAETYAALSGTAMWAAIFLPVALVIGAIYLVVAMINYFTGTSISATGIVVGAFFWLGGMIYNVIALTWNMFLSFAEFLGNVFRNPTAATYNLFVTVWNGIVELVGRSINEIIGLINKIPGMEIGFVNWGKSLAKKMTIEGGLDLSAYNMDYSSGNFMKGYDIGSQGISNIFPGVPKIPDKSPVDLSNYQSNLGDLGDDAKKTADNTGKIKDAMEITDEDIKYLRDIAEQEVINKYTTAEVKIEMGGIHNNVSNDTDLDGMVRYVKDSLFDAMAAGAEKVHP